MNNSETSTTIVPSHGHGLLRRFPKGVSGNPGGKPAGLMGRVQKSCRRDGKKLVDALLAVAFGTPEQREKLFHEKHLEVTTKDRLRAIEMLLDRGWGRPFVPEDDMPFVPTGAGGPTLVFNIPRPVKELEGRTTVVDAVGPSKDAQS